MDRLQPWVIVASVGVSFISTTLATLAFVARLIFTGKLVPKSLHDQVRQDRDERVKRAEKIADDYKTANDNLWETVHRQGALLETISETTKTTHALVNGIQQAAIRSSSVRQPALPVSPEG